MKYPKIGSKMRVVSGSHKGKYGIVTGVNPSSVYLKGRFGLSNKIIETGFRWEQVKEVKR